MIFSKKFTRDHLISADLYFFFYDLLLNVVQNLLIYFYFFQIVFKSVH